MCVGGGRRCPEGTCVSAELMCNGEADCSDASDEPSTCGRSHMEHSSSELSHHRFEALTCPRPPQVRPAPGATAAAAMRAWTQPGGRCASAPPGTDSLPTGPPAKVRTGRRRWAASASHLSRVSRCGRMRPPLRPLRAPLHQRRRVVPLPLPRGLQAGAALHLRAYRYTSCCTHTWWGTMLVISGVWSRSKFTFTQVCEELEAIMVIKG